MTNWLELKRRGASLGDVVMEPVKDVELAFNPAEPRDAKGQWTINPANILASWADATEGERTAGAEWYPAAHNSAVALAKKYGVSKEEAAGLLATYSPQTPWGRNQIEASEALREGHGVGGPGGKVWFTHDDDRVEDRVGIMAPGSAVRRADRLLKGEDFDDIAAPKSKTGIRPPKALKIRAFYHLIASGGQDDPDNPRVVIDRHAMSVAYGQRVSNDDYDRMHPASAKTYKPFVDAYVEAARRISEETGRVVTPENVQATTWLVQQRQNSDVDSRRASLGKRDWDEWSKYAARYLGLDPDSMAATGYTDLANPSLGRTRRLTQQLKEGESPYALLRRRRVDPAVAAAMHNLVKRGTKTRPNARLHGSDLTLSLRKERDREALYRGAYLLKAANRVQEKIEAGQPLSKAMADERRFFKQHELARKRRLDSSVLAHKVGQRFGEDVGGQTLIGWYLNPYLNNDEECLKANGHNFFAELGTIIGFPGAVHLNCGCYAGPPIEGAAMVDDVLRGLATIEHAKKPTLKLKSRKRHTA